MIFGVTGASGQLGRATLDALLDIVDGHEIVALARDPSKLQAYASRGVTVRAFDYDDGAAHQAALEGVTRLLLISSNALGRRTLQHAAVIGAARSAGVERLLYTSILRADENPLSLALEHRETEALIRSSGMDFALLRNGWYSENFNVVARTAAAQGALLGSAGTGRFSTASRIDYAEAAARVLTGGAPPAQIYELAGDDAFTMAELAAYIGEISGSPVSYRDMSEEDYRKSLEDAGLPGPVATLLADNDAKAAGGALFSEDRTLFSVIGRPTTPWRESVRSALLS